MAVETVSETHTASQSDSVRLAFPTPKSIPFFHHPNNAAREMLQPAIDQFGREHISAAIGYGSYFFGTPTPTSRVDLILITPDIQAFHERQMTQTPQMYGWPHIPEVHGFYDRSGPTPYRTEFATASKEPVRGKIMVMSESQFIDQCRGGVRDAVKERPISPWDFYIQGRMQKHDLTPITPIPREVQEAITQARINGVALSLGLLPHEFNWEELAQMLIRLSYKADVRLEQPDKQRQILAKAYLGYHQMVTAIADGFVDTGVLGKTDFGYRKQIPIREDPIEKYLIQAQGVAAVANYGKNWVAGGIGSGLVYVFEKAARVINR